MNARIFKPISIGSCIALMLCTLAPGKAVSAAAPAAVMAAQLASLLPDEQDLQGFVRIQPPAETPEGADAHWLNKPLVGIKPRLLADGFHLNGLLTEMGISAGQDGEAERGGMASRIDRLLYSTNGIYSIHMTLEVCESTNSAHHDVIDFLSKPQIAFWPGTFSSPYQIGDESWCNSGDLLFRYGRVVVEIWGGRTFQAVRANYPPVPEYQLASRWHA